jgi:transcriptional regulator with XRE-family HTH domain
MGDSEDGARALGEFLRSRRERLRPADVGLPSGFPAGPRRRVKGLRRDEVARLAHLSPTWYAYLEQGRPVVPSPAVLENLARALGLTADERAYLHQLARRAAGWRQQPADPPGELMAQVVALHADSPFPVHAVDVYCDVLAWNQASCDWYDDWSLMPSHERNFLHWILVSPVARRRIVDWEDEVTDLVARWRPETARQPADPRFVDMISRFRALSPLFDRVWDDHNVLDHAERLRVLRHDVHGVRRMRAVPMSCPAFRDGGIIVHLPVEAVAAD